MRESGPPKRPLAPAEWPQFQDLLEASREGAPGSREALFARFYPRVERMVHHSLSTDLRVKRPWIASMLSTGDVVQEVFISVLQDLDAVESTTEEAFAGYLARIVRNRLIDSLRFHQAARRDGRKRVGMPEAAEPRSYDSGPATRVAAAESFELYNRALESFSQRERLLLSERIEDGMKFQRLADHLGYPSADAARKAFYVAQARLLLKLQTRGEEGSG